MESKADMLSRVCMMAEGDPTWDLSDNDIRALRSVLAERNEYKQASLKSDLRIRDLEAQLAEARKDGARLDHVIDNLEDGIDIDGWYDHCDFAAVDAADDWNEAQRIEYRKAWRKYIDSEIDAATKGGETDA